MDWAASTPHIAPLRLPEGARNHRHVVLLLLLVAREGNGDDEAGVPEDLHGKLDAATASMAKYWGSQIQNEVMD